MKIAISFRFFIMSALILTGWFASPVYAQTITALPQPVAASSPGWKFEKAKGAELTVKNRTGGTLYVKLTGHRQYYFVIFEQGNAKFNIEAGSYTYYVGSSLCSGRLSKTRKFASKVSIGPFGCDAHGKIELAKSGKK